MIRLTRDPCPGYSFRTYEVNAQIGEGGAGQLYWATATTLKPQVAIKISRPLLAPDPTRLARFRRADVLASVNPPNISADPTVAFAEPVP